MNAIKSLLDWLTTLLSGEPLRAITYGAAAVGYFVARATGVLPEVSFDQAVIEAGTGFAILLSVVEFARKFVYSPNTVEAILAAIAASAIDGVTASDPDGV